MLQKPVVPTSTSFAVWRDGQPVPAQLEGAVAAIGNFDGVHRGHQELIRLTLNSGRPGAVVTFEPHPRALFQPDFPLFRLTPEPVKLTILERLQLSGAFVLGFTRDFAALTADQFVDLLAHDLKLSGVLIGYDFHFGSNRSGSPATMKNLCKARGLDCSIAPAVTEGTEPVSSSAIRLALSRGEVAEANRLLGFRWFVRGDVRHGEKRGRELGYPTANMRLPDDCRLAHGIYAVRARVNGTMIDGVASFGKRPTFDNGAPLLEVHLFDFFGDLYGQTLDVEFIGWIRGEEKFSDLGALTARMDIDAAEAKAILASDRTRSMVA